METIFLEQWLHNKVRQKVATDPEYRRFIGKENLAAVTRADIDNFQLFGLKKTLAYAGEKSSFYRELFHKIAIKPEDIRSLADLARIPLTSPRDLAENPYRFVCGSLADIDRIITFISSGTTGPRKKIFCTVADIERITDFMGAGMRTVAAAGDVVQIILPFGSENNQGELLAKGVEKIGAVPLRAGITLSAEEQLELIRHYQPAILFATVSRLYRITQELRTRHSLDQLGIKTLFLCTGYLSPPIKKRLEMMQTIWNCDVHTHYGLAEMGIGMAVECHAHNGYHFNEADLLLEVVDPATGETITDDREGELVFTTLNREGTPLIRYRTHNRSRLVAGPCPCAATTLIKFGAVTRRLESLVSIGDGDQLYPGLFNELLFGIPQVIDYQVRVSGTGGKDDLAFVVEVTKVSQKLRQEIRDVLYACSVIRSNVAAGRIAEPKLDLVVLGELKPTNSARQTILDHRQLQNY